MKAVDSYQDCYNVVIDCWALNEAYLQCSSFFLFKLLFSRRLRVQFAYCALNPLSAQGVFSALPILPRK